MAAAYSRRTPPRSAPARVSDTSRHSPMVQMGFEGSRHMIPQRLPSAKKERTVALRVIDLNDCTIEQIQAMGPHLKRLDLSNLKISNLDDDIFGSLECLERLNLGFNELTDVSLPSTFKLLENLVELSMNNNKLTVFPKLATKLKNITRLKLAFNGVTTLDGLEKLKKLQVLVLDNNKIEAFTKDVLHNLKRLEIIQCSTNLIKEIPCEVRNLRFLKDLDISNNLLTYLPPEVLLLPRIEVLSAGGNQISRLPSINVKSSVKRKLNFIDLSDNCLIKFPGHLIFMTDRLDLSRNKIRSIPGSLIQKLDWGTDKTLLLDDNPLNSPPVEVCACGIKAVIQYFQEAKTDMKIYQGLKVLVLGASGQGKTSLVQTLVDQQSRLTGDERTMGLDAYDYSIDLDEDDTQPEYNHNASHHSNARPNSDDRFHADDDDDDVDDSESARSSVPSAFGSRLLNLSIWDFSGNQRYTYPHYIFMHQPAVLLLVFSLPHYTQDNFYSLIGYWIDLAIAKSNSAVILPVGTHKDKVSKSKVKVICKNVTEAIHQHLANHKTSIECEIKKIESKPHISPALSEQLKHYLSLLKVQYKVHEEVVPVSLTTADDLPKLVQAVQDMGIDPEFFPNVMRTIPSLWGEVENYVEERGYALNMPVFTWENYVNEITGKFGMKHLMEQITQYLHDTGKVLWFYDHPYLKDFVILRPSWIADVFRQIFRHDIEDMDYTIEESFKTLNISPTKFDKLKADVIEEGLLDKDYLRGLWYCLTNSDLNKPVFEIISLIVEKFEIGYGLTKSLSRERDRLSSAVSRAGSEHSGKERADSASTTRSVHFTRRNSIAHSEKSDEKQEGQTNAKTSAVKADKDNQIHYTKVIIPWLRELKQPTGFQDEYEKYRHKPVLAAIFRFPKFIPPGLFEKLVVRCHRPEFDLCPLYHWKSGLYGRQKSKPTRFYLLRIEHDDGCTCLRVEVRLEGTPSESGDRETEVLWSVLLPFIKDTEELISKFAGARLERYVECPFCNDMTFLGEWQTPKELQSMSSKTCEGCKTDVPTDFLIQPKDRKKVEELILQKKQTQEAEKRHKLETMTEEEEEKDAKTHSPVDAS